MWDALFGVRLKENRGKHNLLTKSKVWMITNNNCF